MWFVTAEEILVIMKYFGIDGCRKGWFYVGIDEKNEYCFDIISNIESILKITQEAQIVLIDIPIGLRENEKLERLCDLKARNILGKRRSSVFPAPSRSAIKCDEYSEASQINFKKTGRKLSKQSFSIAKKIENVDKFFNSTSLQTKYREMHPEVCFWALNNKTPMEFSKRKSKGFLERKFILKKFYPYTEKLVEEAMLKYLRKDLAKDDIINALVGAVSATFYPNLSSLPNVPELDRNGLKMEIVYPNIFNSE